jgi:hypothetical protein
MFSCRNIACPAFLLRREAGMESYSCATCNSTKRPGIFKQDVLPSWSDPVGRL